MLSQKLVLFVELLGGGGGVAATVRAFDVGEVLRGGVAATVRASDAGEVLRDGEGVWATAGESAAVTVCCVENRDVLPTSAAVVGVKIGEQPFPVEFTANPGLQVNPVDEHVAALGQTKHGSFDAVFLNVWPPHSVQPFPVAFNPYPCWQVKADAEHMAPIGQGVQKSFELIDLKFAVPHATHPLPVEFRP